MLVLALSVFLLVIIPAMLYFVGRMIGGIGKRQALPKPDAESAKGVLLDKR
ncbi:MAG: hypothetical protein H7Z10_02505 [Gemmatimonadaceae bacterium]|nr:hypothetical protein [Acetobacteraceae bacterium]